MLQGIYILFLALGSIHIVQAFSAECPEYYGSCAVASPKGAPPNEDGTGNTGAPIKSTDQCCKLCTANPDCKSWTRRGIDNDSNGQYSCQLHEGNPPDEQCSTCTHGVVVNQPARKLINIIKSMKNTLIQKLLPHTLQAIDRANGGYVLGETTNGLKPEDSKIIISQTRLLWAFSYAHNLGFSSSSADYLDAAKSGYAFLQKNFFDQVHGGYYWSTDAKGNPVDKDKYQEGQSYIILSFCEYYKASRDPMALAHAKEVFQLYFGKRNNEDAEFGGFYPDFSQDWELIDKPEGGGPLGSHGLQTDSSILHMAQGLTSLLSISNDDQAKVELEKLMSQIMPLFFPPSPSQAVSKYTYSGEKRGEFPQQAYGHTVASAWIRIEAELMLGRNPSWDIFDSYMQYALSMGIEPTTKGLLENDELVWWAQFALIKAVATDKKHRGGSQYDQALSNVLSFVECMLQDSQQGFTVTSVWPDSTIRNNEISSKWKSAFNAVRAIGALSEAL